MKLPLVTLSLAYMLSNPPAFADVPIAGIIETRDNMVETGESLVKFEASLSEKEMQELERKLPGTIDSLINVGKSISRSVIFLDAVQSLHGGTPKYELTKQLLQEFKDAEDNSESDSK